MQSSAVGSLVRSYMMIRDTLFQHLEPVGQTFLQVSTFLLAHHKCSSPLSAHVMRQDVDTLRHGILQPLLPRLQEGLGQTRLTSTGTTRHTKRGIAIARLKLGLVNQWIGRKSTRRSKSYLSKEHRSLEIPRLPALLPPEPLNQCTQRVRPQEIRDQPHLLAMYLDRTSQPLD